jgi:hypothetical protein
MVNWKRDRERNLNGKWGSVRVEQILAKRDGDVTIAPDWSDIAHYSIDRRPRPANDTGERSAVMAIVYGIIAALAVVGLAALV